MESVSSQSTPIPDYPTAASDTMDIVTGMLRRMGRIHRLQVSRQPLDMPSETIVVMTAPLLDRRRNNIGTIRVYVIVNKMSNDIKVRLEWTRHAFGFWFRQDVWLYGAAVNPKAARLSDLERALYWVRQTADGTTTFEGQLRMLKKVKKNRSRDRAAQIGLVMG
jgi:hypothetical protein